MGQDADNIFNQVKQNIIAFFSQQVENQALIHLKKELRKRMNKAADFKKKSILDVALEVRMNFNSFNEVTIYKDIKSKFLELVSKKDYDGILRVFNFKKAIIPNSNVCSLIGISGKDVYKDLIISLLKNKGQIGKNISESIDRKILKYSLKVNNQIINSHLTKNHFDILSSSAPYINNT